MTEPRPALNEVELHDLALTLVKSGLTEMRMCLGEGGPPADSVTPMVSDLVEGVLAKCASLDEQLSTMSLLLGTVAGYAGLGLLELDENSDVDVDALVQEWINVRRCRVCGCTDDVACDDGCEWVEAHLCSACVGA